MSNHHNPDGHERHPLVGRLVRDTASGVEGRLMAVVREELPSHTGTPRWIRRAYIRPRGGGVERIADLADVEPVDADRLSLV
ncbi:hypothetical protein ACFWBH_32150 [Streptomyces sp. NPDC059999]|uniref:hypothetical protein n=1 Tax=unclassified Streptomyces TaxID=2593676 RepID=UPI002E32A983|nr:hypothetical protein [Streptomyces sp. NBC_01426]